MYAGIFAAVGVYRTENFTEALCLSWLALLRWLQLLSVSEMPCPSFCVSEILVQFKKYVQC